MSIRQAFRFLRMIAQAILVSVVAYVLLIVVLIVALALAKM